MEKTFVLDTNVILYDPMAIQKFGENKVVIPLIVIEEIDKFKKDQNENGRNARHFSRIVDEFRKEGSLTNGVDLPNGGTLYLIVDERVEDDGNRLIDLNKNDNLILASALSLSEKNDNIILVTKDINLRLKADVLGITAEDYGKKDVTFDELYPGHSVFEVEASELADYEKNRFFPIPNAHDLEIYPNQYLIVCEKGNDRHRALGRYHAGKKGIVPLITMREGVWGIYPKNMEQQFALDALLNDEIKFVSLVGKAGTGKTLLAIAAGLEMTIGQEKYNRLLVSRPIQPMGRDLGYLPGDVNEKLGPWMQPIFDNMDFLFGQSRHSQSASYEDLINNGLLHIEPLTYIRGRSIPGQYLIVDEAQNLSPHEVKTIITRAGEGTKIVLTGDCHQIDNPYLDEVNNGLVYALDRLKTEDIVAHTTLKMGERSALSEAASKLL
ncbi:MAG: phosphate starvation-inducible protein PhoH [Bdellovibrio sp. CG12_big_fil_rev_8_21_14_0_65_39_13]|nr:MAG: phosphate starvation-inducible protein PhoH [Bdellovibrio sp. CG22_combo_CG10-13_8_21_14_all_39_27]PIQ57890.1 MAG: phosphate starvation-inducible protein PhoH [Bdellovibrio sp. CG12_big_fil_rev_8_21_14_0_65_39_13]PIR34559.1 MAG: phosphate starvation-inducible protein PhoH [Bdellovibrio sp. CG11_big_fil_rev_8_21_14_0_20_39_38]